MSEKKTIKVCLGRPRAVGDSTLATGLYSKEKGRLGQVLISVNVVAIYGGAVEVPPEIMEKIKELLSPERTTGFYLGDTN